MITITWHFFTLWAIMMFTFCYAITRRGKGLYGDKREWAVIIWSIVWLIILAIYGGFVWW